MSEALLTIAQTATQLGISERTLRRALREPNLQAMLTATSRHIGGRVRLVSLVDPYLLSELRRKYFSEQQTANQQAATGKLAEETVKIYERLIDEQAHRIADLQSALGHERRQCQRLADALLTAQARLAEASEAPVPSVLERLFGRKEKPHRRPKNS